jgi:hypothetical protein
MKISNLLIISGSCSHLALQQHVITERVPLEGIIAP